MCLCVEGVFGYPDDVPRVPFPILFDELPPADSLLLSDEFRKGLLLGLVVFWRLGSAALV